MATTHHLGLTVVLKAAGNEARSALEALQEKMHLRDRVAGLEREELWELDVKGDTASDAEKTVRDLVKTTNLFANPNKHRYSLSAAGGTAPGRDDEVVVLVTDREGTEGESVLSAIRRIGVDDVVAVRKWVLWRVRLVEPPARGNPELMELIRKIGVASGRRDGLLSNPHSQISRAILPWGEEKVLAA